MKTKVKKQLGNDYGEVHIKQYKRALDRIELLEGQIKGLNARLSCLLTVFSKADIKTDAVGKEVSSSTVIPIYSFYSQHKF